MLVARTKDIIDARMCVWLCVCTHDYTMDGQYAMPRLCYFIYLFFLALL